MLGIKKMSNIMRQKLESKMSIIEGFNSLRRDYTISLQNWVISKKFCWDKFILTKNNFILMENSVGITLYFCSDVILFKNKVNISNNVYLLTKVVNKVILFDTRLNSIYILLNSIELIRFLKLNESLSFLSQYLLYKIFG